jgi:hypothetical protein
MLGTHSLALFATTVFVINATPGVDMMLTLTQTLRHGVRGGLAAAAGHHGRLRPRAGRGARPGGADRRLGGGVHGAEVAWAPPTCSGWPSAC